MVSETTSDWVGNSIDEQIRFHLRLSSPKKSSNKPNGSQIPGRNMPLIGHIHSEEYIPETADIVVAIPSFDEADSIGYVVEQAARGIKKLGVSGIIANLDNPFLGDYSTKKAFFNAESYDIPKLYLGTPPEIKGKGNNFLNLFWFLNKHINFEAGLVVDADLKSITPEWIERLFTPIESGSDFVTPLYSRDINDGTITNQIIYPLIYSVLGENIRQAIGGEFAFSPRMVDYWLKQEWHESRRQYGVDIAMTLDAVLSGMKISQAFLGAKIHKPSAPKLGEMLKQVADTAFRYVGPHIEKRNGFRGPIYTPPIYGDGKNVGPEGVVVNPEKIIEDALKAYSAQTNGTAGKILGAKSLKQWEDCLVKGEPVDSMLWAETLLRIAHAHPSSNGNRKKIIDAFLPFYLTRVASFALEEHSNYTGERAIQEQAEHARSLVDGIKFI